MTFTHALSTNNYGCAKFIVDASSANGTHTTIASALTSASSGDTIFIRPGTYTENLTLKAGVNLTAYVCDAFTPNVTIVGKCTFTGDGTIAMSGIRFQTNGDYCVSITGSSASRISLINCYLDATNFTVLQNSSSSGSSSLGCTSCRGDLGTTGISYGTNSGAGYLLFRNCDFENTGLSTTATTASSGVLAFRYVRMVAPVSTSGTADIQVDHSIINCGALNTTAITHNGSGANSNCVFSNASSGTASAISVGSGATLTTSFISVGSTNTNPVTGVGTIIYSGISFPNTSSTINTTTQTARTLRYGQIRSTKQPGFFAYLGVADSNVTGAGTEYRLGQGNALTEVFDQGGDFNTNGTFTAPVTGRYFLQYCQSFGGLTSAMTQGLYRIVTSNNIVNINLVSVFAAGTAGNNYTTSGSVFCDMDAADTATFTTTISNGAGDTADVLVTSGGAERTYVSGFMLC